MTYAAPEGQLKSSSDFGCLRKLARHRSFRIGFFIILVMVAAAILRR